MFSSLAEEQYRPGEERDSSYCSVEQLCILIRGVKTFTPCKLDSFEGFKQVEEKART